MPVATTPYYMSIIRKVLMSIIRCIGCGFVGVLVAGVEAVCVYFLFDVFTPNGGSEGGAKAWGELALMVMGFYGTLVGFALGAIYGAIRTFTMKGRTIPIAMSVISATLYLIVLGLVAMS